MPPHWVTPQTPSSGRARFPHLAHDMTPQRRVMTFQFGGTSLTFKDVVARFLALLFVCHRCTALSAATQGVKISR